MTNETIRKDDTTARAAEPATTPLFDRLRPHATLLTLGVGATLAPGADAATFNVTTLADDGAGSLRDAIGQANAAAGADTITFQAGLTGTITLTTGQLEIFDDLTITGPGAASLAVSGNNASRVFYLYNGKADFAATISGLTIDAGRGNVGGGVVNYGQTLTLDQVTISRSTASGTTALGGGVAVVFPAGSLTIIDSVISGNDAGLGGGVGIYGANNVTIRNSTISGNDAVEAGGGMMLYAYATTMLVENTTINDNTATQAGGGIAGTQTGGGKRIAALFPARHGAASRSRPAPDGVVASIAFVGTTLSNNSAATGGGVGIGTIAAPIVFENCTISGNAAAGLPAGFAAAPSPLLGGGPFSGSGGGVLTYQNETLDIRHTTISANTAITSAGGILAADSVTRHDAQAPLGSNVTIDHTILADNTAPTNPDLLTITVSPNVTFSLIEAPSTAVFIDGGGNVLNTDPQLGALANNGGPTMTRLLSPTSPALNAGDAAFAPPPATDQRGLPRVAEGRIDIGAVEVEGGVPGTLQFVLTPVSVVENAGSAVLTVSRVGGSDGAISVDFASADGTAVAPGDYTAVTGPALTWPDGDTASKTITVPIVDDAIVEAAESFTVTLSNPQGGATLGAQATATVTITDNDSAPVGGTIQFTIAAVSVNETDGTATISVSRSGGTGPVTVDYATTDGTAIAPGDFASSAGTLTWPLNDVTPKNIVVPIVNDGIAEPAETFTVALSNATGGATIAGNNATVTIAASAATGGTPPVSVPASGTLSQTLLAAMLAAIGALMLRRREARASR